MQSTADHAQNKSTQQATNNNVSLLLEGGGMRGFFTAGALNALDENGIHFNHVVGVSSGSLNALIYMTKTSPADFLGEMDTRISSFIKPRGLVDVYNGILDTDRFFSRVQDLYPLIVDSAVQGYTTTVDAETAQLHQYQLNTLESAELLGQIINASCSIPVVMPRQHVAGDVHVDGGIIESIPVHIAEGQGFSRHVLILTQQAGYIKKQQRLELYLRRWLKPYPQLKESMLSRHVRYNKSLAYANKLQDEKKAVIIRPEHKVISRFDLNFKRFTIAYNHGREVALKNLKAIEELID